jgi:lysozyme
VAIFHGGEALTPSLRDNSRRFAKLSEGFEPKPYLCPAGHWTIGYGHNLDAAPLTIVLDRPIEEGITEAQACEQLDHDIHVAWDELVRKLPWVISLDNEARQGVLLDMTFNMGWPVFSEFRATQRCAHDGMFMACAEQMMRSKWYGQVGVRGRRLVAMMQSGRWPWQTLNQSIAEPDHLKTLDAKI